MIKKPQSMVLGFVSWLLLCFSASADQEVRIDVGEVERVQNLAEAVYGDETRSLGKSSTVKRLDLLKTGADARLEVRLNDGSKVTLGDNAELVVDDFVHTPKQERAITLNALKGALRFVGQKLEDYSRQEVKVKTPVATLGIRGTHFWVGRIDGETGVLVLDGNVLVNSRYGLVSLGPGEGTMIKDNGTLSPVKKWGEKKKARALETVRFK